jgi:hypothetical protein
MKIEFTDLFAYSLMITAAVICGIVLDGIFGWPRWFTLTLAIIVGPVSAVLGAYIVIAAIDFFYRKDD